MQHETLTTSFDSFRLPPPRFTHTDTPSLINSQAGWSRSLLPPAIEALDRRFATAATSNLPRSPSWLRFTSTSQARSTDSRQLPTPPADDMSSNRYAQSNSNGTNVARQQNISNSVAPQSYQSSTSSSGAYPYAYSARQAEPQSFQNGAVQSYHTYGERQPVVSSSNEAGESRRPEPVQERQPAIHPNMQIPATVNNSRGSICELTAQVRPF